MRSIRTNMERTIRKASKQQGDDKMSKTQMENIRRTRLRDEFQKTRDIVDARRPGLEVKMEQGDILEQMRLLFLSTEQQLRACEAQLAQMQQVSSAACMQAYLSGFQQGKLYSEWEPYIKLLSANNNNMAPAQLLELLQQQTAQNVSGSEPELSTSLNSTNQTNQTADSGLNLTFNDSE